MAAKRSSKEYSNAEAVDIIHQVANLVHFHKGAAGLRNGRRVYLC